MPGRRTCRFHSAAWLAERAALRQFKKEWHSRMPEVIPRHWNHLRCVG
jgi:hypothetical protein